ncbi:MAG: hypothetical protein CM15mP130_1190 [Verrucomicrobiota bacterium]|nr:MAG: hypothetical protein CM15mP130_1190 [Verrucomicrobiota bacterium]
MLMIGYLCQEKAHPELASYFLKQTLRVYFEVAIPNGNQLFLQLLAEGCNYRLVSLGIGKVSKLMRVFSISKARSHFSMFEATFLNRAGNFSPY